MSFDALIRMLEDRLKRQKVQLAQTEAELKAARDVAAKQQELLPVQDDRPQPPRGK